MQGKRRRGRPNKRWLDYIRDDMKEYKCREREEGGGPRRDDWTISGMTRKSTSAGKEKKGRPK